MLATMLQDFVCELEAQVEQWAQELWRTLDLAKLEEELSERMQRLHAGVVGQVLTELLSEPSYKSVRNLISAWQAADQFNLPIVTELMDIRMLDTFMKYGVDVIQIGTRNMQDFDLLKEVGQVQTPVILKRGMAAWLY
jgi:sialic acid synthase SpsE